MIAIVRQFIGCVRRGRTAGYAAFLCALIGPMAASSLMAQPLAQPEVLYEESIAPAMGLEPPAVDLASLGESAPYGRSGTGSTQDLASMLDSLRRDAPCRSMLETMLFEQVRAALPDGGNGYILEKVNLPDMALPAESWSVRYDFRIPARGIGPAPFTAILTSSDGRQLRRFSGSLVLDREAQGMQATRLIRRGEPVGPGDLKPMAARLSQLPRNALDGRSGTDGAVARNELRPGMWLTGDMLKIPEVIRRGQGVKIVLQRGPIRIAAPGVTRQGGALGEVIKVENAESGRPLFARVISKEEVQVIN